MAGRVAGILVAVAWLTLPAVAAQAATVSVTGSPGDGSPKGGSPPSGGVVVTAAPGEANHLTFATAGANVVVRDPSAPLVPGTGCTATAPGEVTCAPTISPLGAITVDAGDGDDVVDAAATRLPLVVDGGSGNDVLHGGTASDRYRPGLGDDTVDATAGGTVLYDERRTPVTIALDGSPVSGEAGEHDALHGITAAVGGAAGDTIDGTDHGETLDGGPGDDTLRAGGGDDHLAGGAGDDRLTGGDGSDTLDGQDGRDILVGGAGDDTLFGGGSPDRLDGGDGDDRLDLSGDGAKTLREFATCGAGHDTAVTPDGQESISVDCERVQIGVPDVDLEPVALALPLRRIAGRLWVRVTCDPLDGGDRCAPRITVRRRHGVRLTGRASLAPGQSRLVALRGPSNPRPREAVWVTVRGTQREDGDVLPLAGGFKVVVP